MTLILAGKNNLADMLREKNNLAKQIFQAPPLSFNGRSLIIQPWVSDHQRVTVCELVDNFVGPQQQQQSSAASAPIYRCWFLCI